MPYRRRRRTPPLVLLILLGVLAGIVFYVRDSSPQTADGTLPAASQITPVSTFPSTATPVLPLEATLSQTAEPLPMLSLLDLGVSVSVIQVSLRNGEWDVSALGSHAGHLQYTGWFDIPGNIVLAGHVELRDGSPGIFANLDKISVGSDILLSDGAGTRFYRVDAVKTVAPDDLSVLRPTEHETLTLLTCSDYDIVTNTYRERVVVTADRYQ